MDKPHRFTIQLAHALATKFKVRPHSGMEQKRERREAIANHVVWKLGHFAMLRSVLLHLQISRFRFGNFGEIVIVPCFPSDRIS